MSRHYTMKDPRIEVEFRSSEEATAKGGIFAIKAFAQECGLWKQIEAEPDLDPRKDKSKGYDPKVYVATFLFGFASGGASMADFERLNDEPGLKRFLGIKRFPDETTLGQWMRNLGDKGHAALMRINREFIAYALKRIDKGRILQGPHLDWFFDDTQLEVTGKCFESAAPNYEGNTTLSWQTLWAGLGRFWLRVAWEPAVGIVVSFYLSSWSSAQLYSNCIPAIFTQTVVPARVSTSTVWSSLLSSSASVIINGPRGRSVVQKNCPILHGAKRRSFAGVMERSTVPVPNMRGCVTNLRVVIKPNFLQSRVTNWRRVSCFGAMPLFAVSATVIKVLN